MSNFLDDLFAARVPEIPYSWTYTSVDPFNGTPGVGFATGVLSFKEGIHFRRPPYVSIPSRYVDSSVKFGTPTVLTSIPPPSSPTLSAGSIS